MNQYKIYRIYLIPENDRVVYIGMTSKHPGVRLYNLCGCNQAFKDTIAKYGPNCFRYDIIETANSKEEAFEKEAYWTRYYLTISPLFNIGIGNNSTANRTKEEMREFYNRTLKPWIEEHGGPNKGHRLTEEQKWKSVGTRSKAVQCIETGIKYSSINEAHRQTGVPYHQIRAACTFPSAMVVDNSHWKFI